VHHRFRREVRVFRTSMAAVFCNSRRNASSASGPRKTASSAPDGLDAARGPTSLPARSSSIVVSSERCRNRRPRHSTRRGAVPCDCSRAQGGIPRDPCTRGREGHSSQRSGLRPSWLGRRGPEGGVPPRTIRLLGPWLFGRLRSQPWAPRGRRVGRGKHHWRLGISRSPRARPYSFELDRAPT